jgi:hypothetical protein
MYVCVCMNNSFDANDAAKRRFREGAESAVELVTHYLLSRYNVNSGR